MGVFCSQGWDCHGAVSCPGVGPPFLSPAGATCSSPLGHTWSSLRLSSEAQQMPESDLELLCLQDHEPKDTSFL